MRDIEREALLNFHVNDTQLPNRASEAVTEITHNDLNGEPVSALFSAQWNMLMRDIGERESRANTSVLVNVNAHQELQGRAFWTEYAAAKYPLVFAHLAERELATRKRLQSPTKRSTTREGKYERRIFGE